MRERGKRHAPKKFLSLAAPGRIEPPAGNVAALLRIAELYWVIRAAQNGSCRRPFPVDGVGHSVGGAIAMLCAHTYPDHVRRIVNVEGNFTLADAFWFYEIAGSGNVIVLAVRHQREEDYH